MTDKDLLEYVNSCFREADQAKITRMRLNEDNYKAYQMDHEFNHKVKGQSTEVLSRVRMATEQTKSFFQQALADFTDWFSVGLKDSSTPEEAMAIRPHEAKKLLAYQYTKSDFFTHVGSAIQSGLLGALIISKTSGKMCPKPKFKLKTSGLGKRKTKNVVAVEDKTWELEHCIVRQEDYYPDPTGKRFYEIEVMWCDLHEIKALSEGDEAIYDKAVVDQLSTAVTMDSEQQYKKSQETGQNTTYQTGHRPKVKLTEFWGNVVDRQGNLIHENVVITIANDTHVIRTATPNPLWHQKSPYTVAPILEVANSVWPIALMDAPTKHQHTVIEMLNLLIDAGFRKVHAPSQLRVQHLVNPDDVADGIPAGMALKVKNSLPPGAKVLEELTTSDVPNDAINVLNLLEEAFNQSALTNDVRSGGTQGRDIVATAVVEASQTITSVFQGISKNIEAKFIQAKLELDWMTIAQNLDMLSKDELVALFGIERGTEISELDPQDVFVQTVNGYKFSVYGISQTLAKAQDFRKLTTLLQTISSSDILIESFLQKYDFAKVLGEIMTALNIDKHKIENQAGQEAKAADAPVPIEDVPPGLNQDQAGTPSAAAPSFADVFPAAGPGGFPGGAQ